MNKAFCKFDKRIKQIGDGGNTYKFGRITTVRGRKLGISENNFLIIKKHLKLNTLILKI